MTIKQYFYLYLDTMLAKQQKRKTRHKRVRSEISGTPKCPRLNVFRSSKHIYAQLIDDESGKTLAAASDIKMKQTGTSIEIAGQVGADIAKSAKDLKLKQVVFDRGGYLYHGRVKALAEWARKGWLTF